MVGQLRLGGKPGLYTCRNNKYEQLSHKDQGNMSTCYRSQVEVRRYGFSLFSALTANMLIKQLLLCSS